MATIYKTSDDLRAHRPDPAMTARLRAMREADVQPDADAPAGEPVFRIRQSVRRRMLSGAYQDGDIAAFRTAFRGVSQARFADALGISIDTLQNWEQGRRQPDGPAKALLRLLARNPRLLAHDLLPALAG